LSRGKHHCFLYLYIPPNKGAPLHVYTQI
jgi:hypothetical protein